MSIGVLGTDILRDFETVASMYASKYRGKTILVKFGGEIVLNQPALTELLKEAITLKNFGANIILLHGGGTQITQKLKEANLYQDLVNGVRPTSMEALKITHECLSAINLTIVNELHRIASGLGSDIRAVGLSGNDGGLMIARPHHKMPNSRTGEVFQVNPKYLKGILSAGLIPVIHPICLGLDGANFNVNADDAAAALGAALKVARLIFMSDTYVYDADKKRITQIYIEDIPSLISDGVIKGGMIAKLEAAARVIKQGVGGVAILDGKDLTALRTEILTDEGAGTLILKRPPSLILPKQHNNLG
ncbi:MAG: acetylglutamate kinase [Alphaproteobacteria bacterium]|nr:acetylglutamate kinase [Alphaproteobacteria bacterium]